MENIKNLFIKLIGTYDIKEEDLNVEGGYSGTISHYNFLGNLLKVYKYIIKGDIDKTIFQFKESLLEMNFKFDPTLVTDEEFEKAIIRRDIVKEVHNIYSESKEDIYKPLIKLVESHSFFEDETITEEEVPVNILLLFPDWIGKNYLNKYTLKEGKSDIPINLNKFKVSSNLYISDNLNYFIKNFNKEYEDDIARVSVFFKIEKEVEYSYFMFIVNYKDHVIAYSDLMLFSNPAMMHSSRSPHRKVEDKHNSGLPYSIIDKLSKIRKDDKTLTKIGTDVEFHTLKWSTFSKYQRVFTLLTIEKLVNNLSEGLGIKIVSSYDHINTLKLESKEIKTDLWEDGEYSNWSESSKKYIKELIDNKIEDNMSTDLSIVSYDLITNSDKYDASMLAPVELHNKHIKWLAVNAQREDIQNKIGTRGYLFGTESNKRNDREKQRLQLNNMLQEKFENVIFKLTQADDLYFIPSYESYDAFKIEGDIHKIPFRFEQYYEKKDNWRMGHLHCGSKYGWGRDDEEDALCPIIPKYKGSSTFFVNIRCFEQLMYLLDCKREDLPLNYRCYKSHDMRPYGGNSILSNTHPLLSLYDPTSEEHPNGISITINLSKRGFNVIKKRHSNISKIKAIDINNTEIFNIDNFKVNTSHLC